MTCNDSGIHIGRAPRHSGNGMHRGAAGLITRLHVPQDVVWLHAGGALPLHVSRIGL